MGRGRAPWPGAAGRRLLLSALLAVTAATALSCAGSPGPEAGSGTGGASPEPPSPGEACVSGVVHWARALLDGAEPYGDHQSMGLSNRQYDILREVVAAARDAVRVQGDRHARELTDRQVREACEKEYADGTPDEGGWR
ncbi:hypothetical protein [Streptomyces sp. SID5606]|uniref:hypothetical protein n=1 Tax=Streptomyces sp. SID5606 TaxID=2690305 RepID=UPI00136C6854|nr:hypothetical protein [Streptomyces sp. SID5606]MZD57286.1 hypothetical protein [Streptomyces sp. SID5606]